VNEALVDACRRYLPASALVLFEAAVAGEPLDQAQRTKLLGVAGVHMDTQRLLELRLFLLECAKQHDPEGTAAELGRGARVFAARVAQREARQREHRQGKRR
jgi:hypothetical protein